jgi:hypothetical protein
VRSTYPAIAVLAAGLVALLVSGCGTGSGAGAGAGEDSVGAPAGSLTQETGTPAVAPTPGDGATAGGAGQGTSAGGSDTAGDAASGVPQAGDEGLTEEEVVEIETALVDAETLIASLEAELAQDEP